MGRGSSLRVLLCALLSTLLGVRANVDIDLLINLDRSLPSTESKGSIRVGRTILLVRENLLLEARSVERQIVLEVNLGLVCGRRRHFDTVHRLLQSVDPVNVEALW